MAVEPKSSRTRFVALLRGINVGGAKLVPMKELRALLAKLGFTGIETLLNSGNAVFSSAQGTAKQHASTISAALEKHFGFEVQVIVKSARDLKVVCAENALENVAHDHSRLLVAFAAQAQTLTELAALLPKVVAPEKATIGRHALYLWCANGILESRAAKDLLGKSGRALTTRNWATVQKISRLLADE